MAESLNIPFFEISCKNNINIEAVFIELSRIIRDQTSKNVNIIQKLIYVNIFYPYLCTIYIQKISKEYRYN